MNYRLYGGIAYKPFAWIEWVLASIFGFNAIYYLIVYTVAVFNLKPITVSQKQRKLLGIKEDDPLFKNEVTLPQKTSELSTPLNFSCMSFSRNSSTIGSPSFNESSMFIIKHYLNSVFFNFLN